MYMTMSRKPVYHLVYFKTYEFKNFSIPMQILSCIQKFLKKKKNIYIYIYIRIYINPVQTKLKNKF